MHIKWIVTLSALGRKGYIPQGNNIICQRWNSLWDRLNN
jgi:hypothetical protein